MSSQARKPYLGLKQSMIDFFSQPTRYIKASNMKESVFEKPYWDGEYPSMHYDPTVPDWPTWKDDPKKRKYPRKDGGGVPVANCPGCALYADPSSDCATDSVEIHSGIFCTSTPGTATEKILTAKQKEYTLDTSTWGMTSATKGVPYGVSAGDCILEVYAEVGAIKEVTIGAWAFIGPSAAVYVDPLISEHRICGRMVDGAGSICIACVDVSCCGCDAPPSALTASYDSTIDPPSGIAYITPTGGCGPYSYALQTGTGWTVSKISETSGMLVGNYGTCGSGADQTSAYAVVRVTDVCGSTYDCTIKNTDGAYVTVDICYACSYVPNCMPGTGTTQCSADIVDYIGLYRHTYTAAVCGQAAPTCTSWKSDIPGCSTECAATPSQPVTVTGVACTAGGAGYCYYRTVTIALWGCP